MDLPQRVRGVGNRTEREGTHDCVEARRLERQVLRIEMVEVHVDRRVADPGHGEAIEVDVGVDGLDAADGVRVVRQVSARAEADFEDPAACGRQRTIPWRVQSATRHDEVEQPRKDEVMVETQATRTPPQRIVASADAGHTTVNAPRNCPGSKPTAVSDG